MRVGVGVCVCVEAGPPSSRRPFGTEPEYFVQLFVEFDESLKTPTVEKLLQKMFKEQQISFAHVGSLCMCAACKGVRL